MTPVVCLSTQKVLSGNKRESTTNITNLRGNLSQPQKYRYGSCTIARSEKPFNEEISERSDQLERTASPSRSSRVKF